MGKNAIIICLKYSKVIGSYGTNDKGQKKCGSTQLSWAVQYKKYLQYDFKFTSGSFLINYYLNKIRRNLG